MAFPIQMINRNTNAHTLGFSGVSWTCFFFGPLPALFRGHITAFLIMLILAVCTIGLSGLVFMFTYNGWHYNWLAKKGFVSTAMQQHTPQSIINVSVGNVGNADYSQLAHLYAERDLKDSNSLPVSARTGKIVDGATTSLPRS